MSAKYPRWRRTTMLAIFVAVVVQVTRAKSTYCDFKSIFHTPDSKYDEYEILERSNFCSEDPKDSKTSDHGRPQAIANAQVMLHFNGRKSEPQHAPPVHIYTPYPPQVYPMMHKHRPHHVPYYQPYGTGYYPMPRPSRRHRKRPAPYSVYYPSSSEEDAYYDPPEYEAPEPKRKGNHVTLSDQYHPQSCGEESGEERSPETAEDLEEVMELIKRLERKLAMKKNVGDGMCPAPSPPRKQKKLAPTTPKPCKQKPPATTTVKEETQPPTCKIYTTSPEETTGTIASGGCEEITATSPQTKAPIETTKVPPVCVEKATTSEETERPATTTVSPNCATEDLETLLIGALIHEEEERSKAATCPPLTTSTTPTGEETSATPEVFLFWETTVPTTPGPTTVTTSPPMSTTEENSPTLTTTPFPTETPETKASTITTVPTYEPETTPPGPPLTSLPSSTPFPTETPEPVASTITTVPTYEPETTPPGPPPTSLPSPSPCDTKVPTPEPETTPHTSLPSSTPVKTTVPTHQPETTPPVPPTTTEGTSPPSTPAETTVPTYEPETTPPVPPSTTEGTTSPSTPAVTTVPTYEPETTPPVPPSTTEGTTSPTTPAETTVPTYEPEITPPVPPSTTEGTSPPSTPAETTVPTYEPETTPPVPPSTTEGTTFPSTPAETTVPTYEPETTPPVPPPTTEENSPPSSTSGETTLPTNETETTPPGYSPTTEETSVPSSTPAETTIPTYEPKTTSPVPPSTTGGTTAETTVVTHETETTPPAPSLTTEETSIPTSTPCETTVPTYETETTPPVTQSTTEGTSVSSSTPVETTVPTYEPKTTPTGIPTTSPATEEPETRRPTALSTPITTPTYPSSPTPSEEPHSTSVRSNIDEYPDYVPPDGSWYDYYEIHGSINKETAAGHGDSVTTERTTESTPYEDFEVPNEVYPIPMTTESDLLYRKTHEYDMKTVEVTEGYGDSVTTEGLPGYGKNAKDDGYAEETESPAKAGEGRAEPGRGEFNSNFQWSTPMQPQEAEVVRNEKGSSVGYEDSLTEESAGGTMLYETTPYSEETEESHHSFHKTTPYSEAHTEESFGGHHDKETVIADKEELYPITQKKGFMYRDGSGEESEEIGYITTDELMHPEARKAKKKPAREEWFHTYSKEEETYVPIEDTPYTADEEPGYITTEELMNASKRNDDGITEYTENVPFFHGGHSARKKPKGATATEATPHVIKKKPSAIYDDDASVEDTIEDSLMSASTHSMTYLKKPDGYHEERSERSVSTPCDEEDGAAKIGTSNYEKLIEESTPGYESKDETEESGGPPVYVSEGDGIHSAVDLKKPRGLKRIEEMGGRKSKNEGGRRFGEGKAPKSWGLNRKSQDEFEETSETSFLEESKRKPTKVDENNPNFRTGELKKPKKKPKVMKESGGEIFNSERPKKNWGSNRKGQDTFEDASEEELKKPTRINEKIRDLIEERSIYLPNGGRKQVKVPKDRSSMVKVKGSTSNSPIYEATSNSFLSANPKSEAIEESNGEPIKDEQNVKIPTDRSLLVDDSSLKNPNREQGSVFFLPEEKPKKPKSDELKATGGKKPKDQVPEVKVEEGTPKKHSRQEKNGSLNRKGRDEFKESDDFRVYAFLHSEEELETPKRKVARKTKTRSSEVKAKEEEGMNWNRKSQDELEENGDSSMEEFLHSDEELALPKSKDSKTPKDQKSSMAKVDQSTPNKRAREKAKNWSSNGSVTTEGLPGYVKNAKDDGYAEETESPAAAGRGEEKAEPGRGEFNKARSSNRKRQDENDQDGNSSINVPTDEFLHSDEELAHPKGEDFKKPKDWSSEVKIDQGTPNKRAGEKKKAKIASSNDSFTTEGLPWYGKNAKDDGYAEETESPAAAGRGEEKAEPGRGKFNKGKTQSSNRKRQNGIGENGGPSIDVPTDEFLHSDEELAHPKSEDFKKPKDRSSEVKIDQSMPNKRAGEKKKAKSAPSNDSFTTEGLPWYGKNAKDDGYAEETESPAAAGRGEEKTEPGGGKFNKGKTQSSNRKRQGGIGENGGPSIDVPTDEFLHLDEELAHPKSEDFKKPKDRSSEVKIDQSMPNKRTGEKKKSKSAPSNDSFTTEGLPWYGKNAKDDGYAEETESPAVAGRGEEKAEPGRGEINKAKIRSTNRKRQDGIDKDGNSSINVPTDEFLHLDEELAHPKSEDFKKPKDWSSEVKIYQSTPNKRAGEKKKAKTASSYDSFTTEGLPWYGKNAKDDGYAEETESPAEENENLRTRGSNRKSLDEVEDSGVSPVQDTYPREDLKNPLSGYSKIEESREDSTEDTSEESNKGPTYTSSQTPTIENPKVKIEEGTPIKKTAKSRKSRDEFESIYISSNSEEQLKKALIGDWKFEDTVEESGDLVETISNQGSGEKKKSKNRTSKGNPEDARGENGKVLIPGKKVSEGRIYVVTSEDTPINAHVKQPKGWAPKVKIDLDSERAKKGKSWRSQQKSHDEMEESAIEEMKKPSREASEESTTYVVTSEDTTIDMNMKKPKILAQKEKVDYEESVTYVVTSEDTPIKTKAKNPKNWDLKVKVEDGTPNQDSGRRRKNKTWGSPIFVSTSDVAHLGKEKKKPEDFKGEDAGEEGTTYVVTSEVAPVSGREMKKPKFKDPKAEDAGEESTIYVVTPINKHVRKPKGWASKGKVEDDSKESVTYVVTSEVTPIRKPQGGSVKVKVEDGTPNHDSGKMKKAKTQGLNRKSPTGEVEHSGEEMKKPKFEDFKVMDNSEESTTYVVTSDVASINKNVKKPKGWAPKIKVNSKQSITYVVTSEVTPIKNHAKKPKSWTPKVKIEEAHREKANRKSQDDLEESPVYVSSKEMKKRKFEESSEGPTYMSSGEASYTDTPVKKPEAGNPKVKIEESGRENRWFEENSDSPVYADQKGTAPWLDNVKKPVNAEDNGLSSHNEDIKVYVLTESPRAKKSGPKQPGEEDKAEAVRKPSYFETTEESEGTSEPIDGVKVYLEPDLHEVKKGEETLDGSTWEHLDDNEQGKKDDASTVSAKKVAGNSFEESPDKYTEVDRVVVSVPDTEESETFHESSMKKPDDGKKPKTDKLKIVLEEPKIIYGEGESEKSYEEPPRLDPHGAGYEEGEGTVFATTVTVEKGKGQVDGEGMFEEIGMKKGPKTSEGSGESHDVYSEKEVIEENFDTSDLGEEKKNKPHDVYSKKDAIEEHFDTSDLGGEKKNKPHDVYSEKDAIEEIFNTSDPGEEKKKEASENSDGGDRSYGKKKKGIGESEDKVEVHGNKELENSGAYGKKKKGIEETGTKRGPKTSKGTFFEKGSGDVHSEKETIKESYGEKKKEEEENTYEVGSQEKKSEDREESDGIGDSYGTTKKGAGESEDGHESHGNKEFEESGDFHDKKKKGLKESDQTGPESGSKTRKGTFFEKGSGDVYSEKETIKESYGEKEVDKVKSCENKSKEFEENGGSDESYGKKKKGIGVSEDEVEPHGNRKEEGEESVDYHGKKKKGIGVSEDEVEPHGIPKEESEEKVASGDSHEKKKTSIENGGGSIKIECEESKIDKKKGLDENEKSGGNVTKEPNGRKGKEEKIEDQVFLYVTTERTSPSYVMVKPTKERDDPIPLALVEHGSLPRDWGNNAPIEEGLEDTTSEDEEGVLIDAGVLSGKSVGDYLKKKALCEEQSGQEKVKKKAPSEEIRVLLDGDHMSAEVREEKPKSEGPGEKNYVRKKDLSKEIRVVLDRDHIAKKVGEGKPKVEEKDYVKNPSETIRVLLDENGTSEERPQSEEKASAPCNIEDEEIRHRDRPSEESETEDGTRKKPDEKEKVQYAWSHEDPGPVNEGCVQVKKDKIHRFEDTCPDKGPSNEETHESTCTTTEETNVTSSDPGYETKKLTDGTELQIEDDLELGEAEEHSLKKCDTKADLYKDQKSIVNSDHVNVNGEDHSVVKEIGGPEKVRGTTLGCDEAGTTAASEDGFREEGVEEYGVPISTKEPDPCECLTEVNGHATEGGAGGVDDKPKEFGIVPSQKSNADVLKSLYRALMHIKKAAEQHLPKANTKPKNVGDFVSPYELYDSGSAGQKSGEVRDEEKCTVSGEERSLAAEPRDEAVEYLEYWPTKKNAVDRSEARRPTKKGGPNREETVDRSEERGLVEVPQNEEGAAVTPCNSDNQPTKKNGLDERLEGEETANRSEEIEVQGIESAVTPCNIKKKGRGQETANPNEERDLVIDCSTAGPSNGEYISYRPMEKKGFEERQKGHRSEERRIVEEPQSKEGAYYSVTPCNTKKKGLEEKELLRGPNEEKDLVTECIGYRPMKKKGFEESDEETMNRSEERRHLIGEAKNLQGKENSNEEKAGDSAQKPPRRDSKVWSTKKKGFDDSAKKQDGDLHSAGCEERDRTGGEERGRQREERKYLPGDTEEQGYLPKKKESGRMSGEERASLSEERGIGGKKLPSNAGETLYRPHKKKVGKKRGEERVHTSEERYYPVTSGNTEVIGYRPIKKKGAKEKGRSSGEEKVDPVGYIEKAQGRRPVAKKATVEPAGPSNSETIEYWPEKETWVEERVVPREEGKPQGKVTPSNVEDIHFWQQKRAGGKERVYPSEEGKYFPVTPSNSEYIEYWPEKKEGDRLNSEERVVSSEERGFSEKPQRKYLPVTPGNVGDIVYWPHKKKGTRESSEERRYSPATPSNSENWSKKKKGADESGGLAKIPPSSTDNTGYKPAKKNGPSEEKKRPSTEYEVVKTAPTYKEKPYKVYRTYEDGPYYKVDSTEEAESYEESVEAPTTPKPLYKLVYKPVSQTRPSQTKYQRVMPYVYAKTTPAPTDNSEELVPGSSEEEDAKDLPAKLIRKVGKILAGHGNGFDVFLSDKMLKKPLQRRPKVYLYKGGPSGSWQDCTDRYQVYPPPYFLPYPPPLPQYAPVDPYRMVRPNGGRCPYCAPYRGELSSF